MQLRDETIEEIRAIFREDYREEISADEAAEMGVRLIRLLQLLLRSRSPSRSGDSPAR